MMCRDRLRTTESPNGRKVATWRLIASSARIIRIQNRADATPAYRWPSREPIPAAAPGSVLFDESAPPDLATAREAFPGHLDLWDAIRHDRLAAIFSISTIP